MTPIIDVQMRDGRLDWDPGESLSGTLLVTNDAQWVAQYLRVVIWWNTEGKGTSDTGILLRQEFATKGELMLPRVEKSIRAMVPLMPWSYQGRLIKIHWHLGVYARERGGPELYYEKLLRIFPGASREALAVAAPSLPDAPPPEE